jgi:hypothetical protein
MDTRTVAPARLSGAVFPLYQLTGRACASIELQFGYGCGLGINLDVGSWDGSHLRLFQDFTEDIGAGATCPPADRCLQVAAETACQVVSCGVASEG